MTLLYRGPEGLVVVDYKTASTSDSDVLNQRVEGCRTQGASYALTIGASIDEPVVRVTFLFLTELAQQMDRALGQFWPRAESRIYEEPKKLVAHGLARASSEMVGKRPRTVYSITAKGRRALAQWVPSPGAGPVLEFEQLIKVFFAEHGTKADLLATLAAVREGSEQVLAASARVPQAYLDGKGPFPERLPWLLLIGQFLLEFQLMIERWAEWSTEIVEAWPDDVTAAEPDWKALETQAAVTRVHEQGLGRARSYES